MGGGYNRDTFPLLYILKNCKCQQMRVAASDLTSFELVMVLVDKTALDKVKFF